VEWKTLVGDSLQLIGFNNFTWSVLNTNLRAVKVHESEINTSESFIERDFFLHKQISTLSLKALVRLLINKNDYVSGLNTWCFITLTVKSILALVG